MADQPIPPTFPSNSSRGVLEKKHRAPRTEKHQPSAPSAKPEPQKKKEKQGIIDTYA
jgi:hypothetical protein